MNNKTLKSLRSFACLNQKNLIKYNYLIAEEHKDLKEYFSDFIKNNSNNINDLKEKHNSFILNSFTELLKILNINDLKITDIFKTLSNELPPKITIKVIQDDHVITIYSSTNINNFYTSSIKENTGFNEIVNLNKFYFLENDLPSRYKKGKYFNPRLDSQLVNQFINNKIKWNECWKNINMKNDSSIIDYYSSTLILPMSIRSNEEDEKDEDFFNHYFEKLSQFKDSRTIWGFLCFDHKNTDYFKDSKNNDLFTDIGYIIADALSLYLIFFYNYTAGSKTITEIRDYIS